ncbi:hypothetical protein, partial [Streptococcus pseudopneumoniae]|uniref:hypothetical protein n=1 Tax=Streptococcus pseudopneumoniae TaxID=257758 RepID=UPI0018B02368
MGPEAVQKVMLQNRKEKEERRMATERQQVVAALEGGVIATGTVVSEKSILVLSEKDKDGNLLE